jgi:hypothetical protein
MQRPEEMVQGEVHWVQAVEEVQEVQNLDKVVLQV